MRKYRLRPCASWHCATWILQKVTAVVGLLGYLFLCWWETERRLVFDDYAMAAYWWHDVFGVSIRMFAYLFRNKTWKQTCWPKWVRTTKVVASFYGEATQASPPSGQQSSHGEEPVDTNLIQFVAIDSGIFHGFAWTAERCMIKVLEVVVWERILSHGEAFK